MRQTKFKLEIEALRDDCVKELLSRVRDEPALCIKLQLWESARAKDLGTSKANVNKIKDTLTLYIRVRVYMHRSGR